MVTSVIGHIYGLNFEDGRVRQLFNDKVEKVVEDTTRKMRVVEHLQELAQEAEYLALWLGCDREGENIIFEVISLCNEWINYDNVYRAGDGGARCGRGGGRGEGGEGGLGGQGGGGAGPAGGAVGAGQVGRGGAGADGGDGEAAGSYSFAGLANVADMPGLNVEIKSELDKVGACHVTTTSLLQAIRQNLVSPKRFQCRGELVPLGPGTLLLPRRASGCRPPRRPRASSG